MSRALARGRPRFFAIIQTRLKVDPEYFLGKSEECFALSRAGRELANTLEAMGNTFMTKAVELSTETDRAKNQQSNSDGE